MIVADDHPVFRRGVMCLLGADPDFDVVGQASNGREVIRLACAVVHDVIVMDLVMPEVDGIEAMRCILGELPSSRVMVLTSHGDDERLFPALDAGALGFVLKDATDDELMGGIRQVAKGLSYLSPSIALRLVRSVSTNPPGGSSERLTAREIEILRVLAQGHSNGEIGEVLHISPATVRTHLTQVFAKLGLTRRTQAMLYALKHGIADLEGDGLAT